MSTDWVSRARSAKLDVKDYVDGRWQERQKDGALIKKYSPRNGEFLYEFHSASRYTLHEAISVARRSIEDGRWWKRPPHHRRDVLIRLASLIEQHRDELALLESLDVGKPISEALNSDLPATAAFIRFYAEATDKLYGKVYAADQRSLSYQLRRPIGLVAGIVGWNFPLVLAAQKIGPVLATGNSLILKPSELTSLATARLAELAVEAGLPRGVFNVVHGDASAGTVLCRDENIDLITFTGSTATGKKILMACGESNMKRAILECGGKSPDIVFDDSPDLEAVAESVVRQAFWNQGEVCSATSRLLIHRTIMKDFLDRVVTKAAAWMPGDPLKEQTRFGALISHGHKQKVLGYIERAEQDGATLAYRSESPPPFERGFYVSPVIFSNVSASQRLAREEIFGPVLSVTAFDDENEAIAVANSGIYGLTATVWTTSMGRAHRVSQGIKAGAISVNATVTPAEGPGAGVLTVGGHKESGFGAEGGLQGMEAYTSETAVQFFV